MVDISSLKPSGCFERVAKKVGILREGCHRAGYTLVGLVAVRAPDPGFQGAVVEGALAFFLARAGGVREQIKYDGTVRDLCCQEPTVDVDYLPCELSGLGWDVVLNLRTREQN